MSLILSCSLQVYIPNFNLPIKTYQLIWLCRIFVSRALSISLWWIQTLVLEICKIYESRSKMKSLLAAASTAKKLRVKRCLKMSSEKTIMKRVKILLLKSLILKSFVRSEVSKTWRSWKNQMGNITITRSHERPEPDYGMRSEGLNWLRQTLVLYATENRSLVVDQL